MPPTRMLISCFLSKEFKKCLWGTAPSDAEENCSPVSTSVVKRHSQVSPLSSEGVQTFQKVLKAKHIFSLLSLKHRYHTSLQEAEGLL